MQRGTPQILALILGLITSSAHSQSLWQWQYPAPQGKSLYAVDILEPGMAIAVGPLGTVVKSSDGGVNWTVESEISGLPRLLGVCIVDASKVVAVGYDGIIVRSTDAGETWQVQTSGTTTALFDVDFADDLVGTAVGSNGTILRSIDGGVTWNPQASGSSAVLLGVCMTDANTGTVVGTNGTILRTSDGGTTWTPQASGTSENLYGVSFFDANTGTAVGVGPTILGTADGGSTWVVQYPDMPPPYAWGTLYSVRMTSATDGFAVGGYEWGVILLEDSSLLMRTTNGGATWSSTSEPTQLYGIAMFSSMEGVAVGGAGMIRRTTDGGLNWPQVGGGLQRYMMQAVDFFDSQHGVAVSYEVRLGFPSSRTYLTNDGGTTWAVANPFTAGDMSDVAFADANTIYAVGHGALEMDAGALIERSTDGGVTWSTMFGSACYPMAPDCIHNLTAVDFAGASAGVAVGADGAIVTILNGSATSVSSPTTEMLRGVSVPTSQVAYAVGDHGVILKGDLEGGSWVPLTSGTSQILSDVVFTDALTGTVVGTQGTILRTTDGGSTWDSQASGTTAYLRGVSFLDNLNGVIVASGMLLKTIDGGATWVSEAMPLGTDDPRSMELTVDVAYVDPTTVTAVGAHENIISRRDIPVATLFEDFSARVSPRSVELRWMVQADADIRGFRVYRSAGAPGEVDDTSGLIAPFERSFTDEHVIAGATYRYTLAAVDARGSESRSRTIAASVPRAQVVLCQNHPNPFNPTTQIRFELPDKMHVRIHVFDTAGRRIATLLDGWRPSGQNMVTWDGKNARGDEVGTGVYYYELRTSNTAARRKMVLVR